MTRKPTTSMKLVNAAWGNILSLVIDILKRRGHTFFENISGFDHA